MRLPVLILAMALPAAAAEIPAGSHALLRMVNSISTRTAHEGDYVYLRTATPIVADGQIVVPADSYVQGIVSKTTRPGRVKGKAELAIRIDTLTLSSGQVVRITPHVATVDSGDTGQHVDAAKENEIQQGDNHGKDAATVATLGGTGAAIGGLTERSWSGAGIGAGAGGAVGLAVVLLTRGRDVTLRSGETMDVVFDRAIPIP